MPRETRGDHERFYSPDPYEVLGVSRDATKEEIDKARKKLLRQYHPDVNKDAMATEIAKLINAAYDNLANPGSTRKSYTRKEPYTPPRQQRQEYQKTYEPRQNSSEDQERDFFTALRFGPNYYKNYISVARKQGLTTAKITEFIRSQEGREIFTQAILQKVKFSTPDRVQAFLKEWQEAGLNLSTYLKLPEVKNELEPEAIRKIRYRGPKDYIAFVDSWKQLGVDLSRTIQTKEVKDFLNDEAEKKIKYRGASDFASFVADWRLAGIDLAEVINSPNVQSYLTDEAEKKIKYRGASDFASFVADWRSAGIDLAEVINSPNAQSYLTDEAERKLKYQGKPQFKSFVDSWLKLGWKPNRTILDLYNKN